MTISERVYAVLCARGAWCTVREIVDAPPLHGVSFSNISRLCAHLAKDGMLDRRIRPRTYLGRGAWLQYEYIAKQIPFAWEQKP